MINETRVSLLNLCEEIAKVQRQLDTISDLVEKLIQETAASDSPRPVYNRPNFHPVFDYDDMVQECDNCGGEDCRESCVNANFDY